MLYTKLADCNRYIIQLASPAAAAIAVVSAVIIYTYEKILETSFTPFTYVIDVTAFIAIGLCIYAYIYSFRYNRAIVAIKIIIALVWMLTIAFIGVYTTSTSVAPIIAEHKGTFLCTVLETHHQRYTTTATVHCNGRNGSYTALCIFSTPFSINPNDTLLCNAHCYPTRTSPSPYFTSLAMKGISAVLYLNEDSILMHARARPSFRYQIQNSILQFLSTTCNSDVASLYAALALGNKHFIHPHVQTLFMQSGVLHILAASGLHVGILALSVLFLCKIFSINRKLSLLAAAIVVSVYFYFSCQPVSLLRASIMFVISSIIMLIFVRVHSFTILCISGTVILCLYPYELFNPGFQLSFAATAGIVLLQQFYKNNLLHVKYSGPIAVSLAAQLVTFPICLYHFDYVSVLSPITTLIILPLITTFMVLGLLLPIGCILGIHTYLSVLIDSIYYCITALLECFSSLYGTLHQHTTPLIILAFITLCIPLVYSKRANIFISAILCCSIVLLNIPKKQYMHFYNDGRSHYFIFTEYRRAHCIISLENFQAYQKLLYELQQNNITHLSLLLPDANYKNCNYATLLAKKFSIKTIIIYNYTIHALKKLSFMAHKDGIPLHFIHHYKQLLNTPWEPIIQQYLKYFDSQ